MAAPRTKRQFAGDASQRQITSYFSKQPSTAAPVSSPPLPSSVQANLLSVGMRVRKSVPEGYKTGSAYSSFKLFTDPSQAPPRIVTPATTNSTSAPSQRELTPFCGLHKVGGLAAPPEVHVREATPEVPSDDEVPGLTLSQESASSAASGSSLKVDIGRARKRFYAEEEGTEHPVQVWRDRDAWLDGEVSPRSVVPSTWGNARVVAVPRKSRRKPNPTAYSMDGGDQENMAVDDFEEAQFIDFRTLSQEMEMSDV